MKETKDKARLETHAISEAGTKYAYARDIAFLMKELNSQTPMHKDFLIKYKTRENVRPKRLSYGDMLFDLMRALEFSLEDLLRSVGYELWANGEGSNDFDIPSIGKEEAELYRSFSVMEEGRRKNIFNLIDGSVLGVEDKFKGDSPTLKVRKYLFENYDVSERKRLLALNGSLRQMCNGNQLNRALPLAELFIAGKIARVPVSWLMELPEDILVSKHTPGGAIITKDIEVAVLKYFFLSPFVKEPVFRLITGKERGEFCVTLQ